MSNAVRRLAIALRLKSSASINRIRVVVLGIICGIALIGLAVFVVGPWPHSDDEVRRTLFFLGIVLLSVLLAGKYRFTMLAGAFFVVVFRGVVGFFFTLQLVAVIVVAFSAMFFFTFARLAREFEEDKELWETHE